MPRVDIPQVDKKWRKQSCARQILENMEKESEALKEYMPLLQSLTDGGYKKAAALIREIMSDEKNHLLILQGILLEFDGGIPVSEDNVQTALRSIQKSIEKDSEYDEGAGNDD